MKCLNAIHIDYFISVDYLEICIGNGDADIDVVRIPLAELKEALHKCPSIS